LGRALQDLVENLHRYVRGGVWYLAVRDGVALIGYAGVDHFYDGTMAFVFNGIRELCGALPDEVPWRASRHPMSNHIIVSFRSPSGSTPSRRPLSSLPASWNVLCPAPIPVSARSWKNLSRNIGRRHSQMARRATHGQDWRAQQSSSAPQNHAGAPNGLEAATELLGFRASLCGQPYPIEGAEAAAPEWRAQHERGHSTDNARISMLAARERAERGRLREAPVA